MTDTMTPEQRSRCMAAVKSKNTKPEIKVRKFLFAKGLRYRINNRRLPGCPDNVDLRLLGWRVIRVWECDIKSKNHTEYLENLYRQIISKKAKTNYATDENASQLAAEQTSDYGKATLIT